ncbi:MAG: hypothetical protein PUP92_36120, partial [Rhizonema sp. PD38]|nr:hypothetical protein [Rhizonema sp. PD38]
YLSKIICLFRYKIKCAYPAALSAIDSLMAEEFIVHTDYIGETFTPLLNDVKALSVMVISTTRTPINVS